MPQSRVEGVPLDVADRAGAVMRSVAETLIYPAGCCLLIRSDRSVETGPASRTSGDPCLVVPVTPIIDHVAGGVEMRLGIELAETSLNKSAARVANP